MALGTEDLYQELMARLRGQPSSGAPAANDFAPPADPNAALRALQEQEKRPAQPQAQRSPTSVSLSEGGETLGGPRAGGMAALGGESAADEGTSALAGALTPSSGSAQYGAGAPLGAQSASIAGRLVGDMMNDYGLTREQAIGAVGWMGYESGNFQTMQEIGQSGINSGWGYAQWTGPRRAAFEQYAAAHGLDPSSYEANYGFLKHELASPQYAGVIPALKQTQTVQDANRVWGQSYEGMREGGPGVPAFAGHAQRAMDYAKTLSGAQEPTKTAQNTAPQPSASTSAVTPAAPQQTAPMSTQQRLASDLMKLDPSMTPEKAAFAAGMAIKSGTIDPNDYEGSVSRMKTLYNNLPDTAKAAIRSQMDERFKQQQSIPKPQSRLTQPPAQSQLNKTVGYVDPSRSTPTTPNNFAGMSTSPVGYPQTGNSSGPQAAAPTPSIGYVQPTAADASEEFADT